MRYLVTLVLAAAGPLSMSGPQQSAPDAVRAFQQSVAQYASLRDRLDRSLPPLGASATALELDTRQRELLALIANARAGTSVGDVFDASMREFARDRVRSLLDGPDGREIRQSLMDENPMTAEVAINRRYPDAIPLSTMPPAIVRILPPLPDGLEYHFVGYRLILLDTHARMVVDVIHNVLRGGDRVV